jgi:hypothetical protein
MDRELRRSVDGAITPLVASLGGWGVVEGHWLPAPNDLPVLWLCTATEEQRRSLDGAPWLSAQVAILLLRLGIPPGMTDQVRIEVSSRERESRLFEEEG